MQSKYEPQVNRDTRIPGVVFLREPGQGLPGYLLPGCSNDKVTTSLMLQLLLDHGPWRGLVAINLGQIVLIVIWTWAFNRSNRPRTKIICRIGFFWALI